MRRSTLSLLLLFLSLSIGTCFSQQTEILRYSVFTAFSYLSTPSLNSAQRGFDGDIGVNLRSWLTFGADFSYQSGSGTLSAQDLSTAYQAKLAPYLPLLIQLGITPVIPFNAATYTYEAGPQFNYRRLKHVTFFARPALGAFHEKFTATPNNPLVGQIVSGLLGGNLSQSDTVVFYGFGGGITWEATPHFGIRVATDLVHYNFFSNLLNGGRNSVRVTVGTKVSFGKNILGK